ncbi:hypothetical protein GDO78_018873, partial [Eleutherodactylus coqui]
DFYSPVFTVSLLLAPRVPLCLPYCSPPRVPLCLLCCSPLGFLSCGVFSVFLKPPPSSRDGAHLYGTRTDIGVHITFVDDE